MNTGERLKYAGNGQRDQKPTKLKGHPMKTALLLASAMIIIFPTASEAHKVKRNCLWSVNNIFAVHTLCRDGNNAPRSTPSRSVAPQPPDKPDCKDDGKHHGKGKGHDKD
jgi:hypothetical protein